MFGMYSYALLPNYKQQVREYTTEYDVKVARLNKLWITNMLIMNRRLREHLWMTARWSHSGYKRFTFTYVCGSIFDFLRPKEREQWLNDTTGTYSRKSTFPSESGPNPWSAKTSDTELTDDYVFYRQDSSLRMYLLIHVYNTKFFHHHYVE